MLQALMSYNVLLTAPELPQGKVEEFGRSCCFSYSSLVASSAVTLDSPLSNCSIGLLGQAESAA